MPNINEMQSWIKEYVDIAKRFHRRGDKSGCQRYMGRAKALKSYLILKNEYQTNAT